MAIFFPASDRDAFIIMGRHARDQLRNAIFDCPPAVLLYVFVAKFGYLIFVLMMVSGSSVFFTVTGATNYSVHRSSMATAVRGQDQVLQMLLVSQLAF